MKLPARSRVLGLGFILLFTSLDAFAQGRSFIWNPKFGAGLKRWSDPANWLPAEPASIPGPQDTAIVQGVSSSGSLLDGLDIRSAADVKVLSGLSGPAIDIDAPLTVLESAVFEGVANYVNASEAQAARLFGTNSLILMGEDNYFGRWTYIACNVENYGYAVVQNIGEMRGSFKPAPGETVPVPVWI